MTGDGVAGDPSQFPGITQRPVQVERSNIFMSSSSDSRDVPPGGEWRISTANRIPGGVRAARSGEADNVRVGPVSLPPPSDSHARHRNFSHLL